MYRYHEQDAICFNESFIFDFINPRKPEQTRPFKFSSAAFWYQDKAVPLAFKLPEKEKLVDWYRMRDTDHQDTKDIICLFEYKIDIYIYFLNY